MSKPKNETPEHREERLRKDRERRAAKRKREKDSQAQIDSAPKSAMQAEIEKAPESAMQTPSNKKQSGQLLSDAAFSYYLSRQNRRK